MSESRFVAGRVPEAEDHHRVVRAHVVENSNRSQDDLSHLAFVELGHLPTGVGEFGGFGRLIQESLGECLGALRSVFAM